MWLSHPPPPSSDETPDDELSPSSLSTSSSLLVMVVNQTSNSFSTPSKKQRVDSLFRTGLPTAAMAIMVLGSDVWGRGGLLGTSSDRGIGLKSKTRNFSSGCQAQRNVERWTAVENHLQFLVVCHSSTIEHYHIHTRCWGNATSC